MSEYINLCKEFISKRKSLLIAPAGYGKTYTIAECLKYTERLHLILTHTHAGVAALKEKIKEKGISSNKYRIETIDSYAQKYVNAFYCGNNLPEQDDENYFSFIIEKASELIKIKPISDVIRLTYTGLFVDEYQDCTKIQHDFIMALSEILPTHLLGDPLQGIFGFRKQQLVDFEKDLKVFVKFELNEPWRWKNINSKLGNCLMEIRKKLENKKNIDLQDFIHAIEVEIVNENEFLTQNSSSNRKIWNLLNKDSLLIIHPESENINSRIEIIKRFNNILYLVEPIDGKDFYKFAKDFDNSNPDNVYETIYNFICKIFNKTEINKWFNVSRLVRKINEQDKKTIEPIRKNLEILHNNDFVNFALIVRILTQIKKLPGVKCYRKELFSDICKALEKAGHSGISVHESMKKIKNRKRRTGRKINGRCIGTTLLIKGLEFDTVVVLNAHKFKNPKDLYVALTRASCELIVFSNNYVLSPF